MLNWFHLAMKMHAIWSSVTARTWRLGERPVFMRRCERLWRKIRNALWHGHAEKAIELTRMLVAASLLEERPLLSPFYASCAVPSHDAATRLLEFLTNNRTTLPNCNREQRAGRHISIAAAEWVMNHLINRRLSKPPSKCADQ